MRSVKKILGAFVLIACMLFLVPNNVDAANIESSKDLKTVFEEKGATVNGKTVTLTKNIEDDDIYDLAGDNYILDLNGYKFTSFEFYVNDGSLTINDSKGNGEISTSSPWFWIEEGAKLIINNGKIDYLYNGGTTIINNGTIENLTNDATMTINAGNFSYFWQRGTVTIKGGTFGSSTIELDNGKTLISGAIEFKKTENNSALVLYSSDAIDGRAINQLLDNGYIAASNGFGTNSYPDELRESGYCYEVTYEPIVIMKDETDEILDKIAPNGIWKINGSKPKSMEESDFLLTSIANDVEVPEGYEIMAWAEPADKFNPEVVSLNVYYNGSNLKTRTVKAVYNEPSQAVKTKVDSILEKIAEKTGENHKFETGFLLEDLYLINYLNASTTGMNSSLALNFSKDLIALTNGSNISYKYDSRLGDFTPTGLWGYSGGQVIVYHDGVAVGTTNIGLTTSHVLYIPSNTKNTDEARIAAALKRIEDYLGTTKGIKITVGGTLESLNEDGATWKDYGFVDEKTSGTNYYNVTINGETYKFAICMKDANQLETPEYLASDILSNISIKSSSTELPLDTAITVEMITSDEIEKVLGTKIYVAYDISLYSNAKKANITKLANGKFVVSIPVPTTLKDKEITVYYINSKGEKEEHIATIKDDVATFETDHFSTYVLTEKTTTENPDTFDNIGNNILIITISLIGIIGTTIYLTKKNKARV